MVWKKIEGDLKQAIRHMHKDGSIDRSCKEVGSFEQATAGLTSGLAGMTDER
jgi:hypothetical protein